MQISNIVEELKWFTREQLEAKIEYLRGYILELIKIAKESPQELRREYKRYIRTCSKILLIYLIELYKRTEDISILNKILSILDVFL